MKGQPEPAASTGTTARAKRRSRGVEIELSPRVVLRGELALPRGERSPGLVIIARGLHTGPPDTRHRAVARALGAVGVGTLQLHLLTKVEEEYLASISDPELLEQRLVAVYRWLRRHPPTSGLEIGFFADGSGSSPALSAAAQLRQAACVVMSGEHQSHSLLRRRRHASATPVLLFVEDDRRVLARGPRLPPEGAREALPSRAAPDLPGVTADWFLQRFEDAAASVGSALAQPALAQHA